MQKKFQAALVALLLSLLQVTAPALSLANCDNPPNYGPTRNFCISASGYAQSEWGQMVINYTITSNAQNLQDAVIHLYINKDRAGSCNSNPRVYEFHVDEDGKLYTLTGACDHIAGTRVYTYHDVTYNKNGASGSFIIPLGWLSDDGDAEVLVQAIHQDIQDEYFDQDHISVEITSGEDLQGGGNDH